MACGLYGVWSVCVDCGLSERGEHGHAKESDGMSSDNDGGNNKTKSYSGGGGGYCDCGCRRCKCCVGVALLLPLLLRRTGNALQHSTKTTLNFCFYFAAATLCWAFLGQKQFKTTVCLSVCVCLYVSVCELRDVAYACIF